MDEYENSIGSILIDPKTGKQTLIEPKKPAQPLIPEPEELSDGPSEPQAPDFGEN